MLTCYMAHGTRDVRLAPKPDFLIDAYSDDPQAAG